MLAGVVHQNDLDYDRVQTVANSQARALKRINSGLRTHHGSAVQQLRMGRIVSDLPNNRSVRVGHVSGLKCLDTGDKVLATLRLPTFCPSSSHYTKYPKAPKRNGFLARKLPTQICMAHGNGFLGPTGVGETLHTTWDKFQMHGLC